MAVFTEMVGAWVDSQDVEHELSLSIWTSIDNSRQTSGHMTQQVLTRSCLRSVQRTLRCASHGDRVTFMVSHALTVQACD